MNSISIRWFQHHLHSTKKWIWVSISKAIKLEKRNWKHKQLNNSNGEDSVSYTNNYIYFPFNNNNEWNDILISILKSE